MRSGMRLAAAGSIALLAVVPSTVVASANATPLVAKPTRQTVQRSVWHADQSFDPSAQIALHTPKSAPRADANGGSLRFHVDNSVEAAQGPAITEALPGQHGDYVRLHSLGAVARTSADGDTVWQRSTESLYADWQVRFQDTTGFVYTPQVVFGDDAIDPFYIATGSQYEVPSTHPVAVGDLAGDRTPDVAIAETVGINLGAVYCFACDWPFDVPGSNLHLGSFVSVLDGRTGRTLYSELDPGIVTQLAVADGQLIVGDETGDPTPTDQEGAWGTTTGVHALTFRHSGAGLTARRAWNWTTHAPWARLFDLVATDSGVALSWSDTPLGLGVPGPPGGHAVLLDPHSGRARWDVRTAGYPVLLGYDDERDLLAVAEETDPTQAIGSTVAGLRLHDGRTAVQVPVPGSVPTALTIGQLAGRGSTWLVGSVATKPRLVNPPNYSYTGGIVSALDPEAQRLLWSVPVGASRHHPPFPGNLLVAGTGSASKVLVGGFPLWYGPMAPTPAHPIEHENELLALDGSTGAVAWDHVGDVADPISLHLTGAGAIVGVTDDAAAITYDTGTGAVQQRAALLADVLTALRHDVNGDGIPDLVIGTQSGGVFALDGRDTSHVLWRADLAGPVHQLALARRAGGPPVLVAAATAQAAVLALGTGAVQFTRDYPRQYVWSVAVGRLGAHPAGVVVATNHLDAFDAVTGRHLWAYRPPVPSYFSNAALIDGYAVAEYQNKLVGGAAPTTMAAIGVDGASGTLAWSAPEDPSTTTQAMLWNGVFASGDIPGGGPAGVAMLWQDANYNGRIEVRDARTGAIQYTNTDSNADYHESWALDPQLGLISIGASSTVVVRPAGAIDVDGASGTSAAFVHSGGATVLLTAQSEVDAYPASVLSTGGYAGEPLASYSGLFSGHLVPAGGRRVIATEYDQRASDVVELGESSGRPPFPLQRPVAFERGAAVLTVSGTPAATTAPAVRAPAVAPSRPSTVTVGHAPPSIGLATPQLEVKVHGYTASGQPSLSQPAPPPYDPALIHSYLGLSGDGSGQTVAVVDAYADPNLVGDVGQFSSQFGLPAVCGTSGAGPDCFHLTVHAPKNAHTDPGWGLETALDVEWIHALAPHATIRLIEARNASFAALFAAVDRAAARSPDAISLSWGYDGEFSDETFYDAHCALPDSVCVAASGDAGHPGGYPAYNPDAVAVGGTTLDLNADATVAGETAWSGSGGGQSYFEPQPPAQRKVVPGSTRGIPDVSFDADPGTGVAVYDSLPYQGQTGWFQVGGTSVGAPVWSAVLTDADQLRAAAGKDRLTTEHDAAARAIYRAPLADITSGPANGICPNACTAGPGYDLVTGLGSPRAGIDAVLAAVP